MALVGQVGSAGGPAAVNDDVFAGDVGGVIACQEQRRGGDLLGFALSRRSRTDSSTCLPTMCPIRGLDRLGSRSIGVDGCSQSGPRLPLSRLVAGPTL